jgi:arabinoxylan arabinofuranohydrolase
MKKSHKFPSIWLGTALLVLPCFAACAANPIITHIRAADPSVEVWPDGKVWIYASHDQNDATNYSSMDGYHAFSSSDMINWTDHGEILHSRDVSWGIAGGGFMWAPDAAYKDGTYYLYFPHKDASGQWRIGVATSLRPEGPFTDVGNYIQGTSFIDPTCFIDDDGEAYLYWGYHKVAKLKSNMIELAESPRTVDYGTTGFQEGVYMHKRNGMYYFSWSRWQSPDAGGHYSTGTSPYGPFTYRGKMASGPPGAQDHHSIIEYCGQSYYFYHVGNYNGGSGNRRNTCVEYLTYNPDGTIQPIIYTTNGVGINVCAPWRVPGVIQTEGWSNMSGVQRTNTSDVGGGMHVSAIDDGDWAEYAVDLLVPGDYQLDLRVAGNATAGRVTITSGGQTNISVPIPATGGWQTWTTVSSNFVFDAAGPRTMRLNFGGGNFNLNWLALTPVDTNAPPVILAQPVNRSVSVGSTATFSVTATGTTPLSYQWLFNALTPVGGNNASLNLTSLAVSNSGNYTVVISNSVGSVTSAVAVLTVTNPPPPGTAVRIEAENYELMSGIQVQATTDAGGGSNVGFIHDGDWIRYTNDLTLSQAGKCRVDFRVASAGAGGTIQIVASGQPIGSVAVANTGGWQNWVAIGTNVIFPSAGPQDITLNFSGPIGFLFNLNWIEVTTAAPAAPLPTDLVWSLAAPDLMVLTWPNDAGWRLQCQTNAPTRGLGSNWFYLEGVISPYTNLINPGEAGIFYRLVYP